MVKFCCAKPYEGEPEEDPEPLTYSDIETDDDIDHGLGKEYLKMKEY